ncbi:unnamed protein product [Closterium sp. Yama58-4]|nr:unnamed protein product [Closterium sp. Yama58-4]
MSAGPGAAVPVTSTIRDSQPSLGGGAAAEGGEAAERGGGGAGDGGGRDGVGREGAGNDGAGNDGVRGDEETLRRLMQSELLFDVGAEKSPLVYCDEYNVRLFGIEKLHPFDSGKWGRIVRFLIDDGRILPHQVVHPRAATHDDLLLVHSHEYLDSLRSSFNLATIGELPPLALFPNFVLQHRVVRPFRYQARWGAVCWQRSWQWRGEQR